MRASFSSVARWIALCALLPLCGIGAARAAITYRANTANGTMAVNSLSFSHYIDNSANRMIIATVHLADSNPADMAVTSMTFNGVAMTLVPGSIATYDAATDLRTMVYYMNESQLPTAGDRTASLVTAGACDAMLLGITFVNTDGAMTPRAVTANTSAGSGTMSSDVTIDVADSLVIDAIMNSGPANYAATGTSQTLRYTRISNNRSGGASTRVLAWTGTPVFSYTSSGGGSGFAHSMVAFTIPPKNDIAGTVFEDTTYSGGVGRSRAASSGVGSVGARVELYDSVGAYDSATTTNASGAYLFADLPGTQYTVRVVGSTVVPSVGGADAVPAQTYRTTGASGSIVAVTNYVGGEDPTKGEAGNGSTTLAALTSGSATPQSIATISNISADVSGVDFGYSFNVISNTRDSGMGSLRQFIVNANAMSGANSAVFMISDGAAHNGLRAGMTNQLTSGVARISLSSALPAITGTNGNGTTISGASQTANVGNTNTGSLGLGGTVGMSGVPLSTVSKPEVEIVFHSAAATGIDVQASSGAISGLALRGASAQDVCLAGSGSSLSSCFVGISASSLSLPSSPTPKVGALIAGNSVTVTANLIAYCGERGVSSSSGVSGATVTYNEVAHCGQTNSAYSGIFLDTPSSPVVRYNRSRENKGPGIEVTGGAGASIQNNTLYDNGRGSDGNSRRHAIIVGGASQSVSLNYVSNNYGAGVWVLDTASAVTISQNFFSGNGSVLTDGGGAASGQLGIDLRTSGDSSIAGIAPYYNLNDDGDGDSGSNGLLNHPVIERAYLSGSNLVVSGWSRAGATIELFLSDGDSSGFGEGATYLGSVVEGGGSDSDAGISGYSADVNCVQQGAESSAARYRYVFAKPGSVSLGSALTATATVSGATSEFSRAATVGDGVPDFSVVKSSVTLSDPANGSSNPKAIPGAIVRYTMLVSNADDEMSDEGSFELAAPIPADTALRVADMDGVGSGPVLFADGAFGSGLTYAFASLSSAVDDVEFSSDGGASWTYAPTPDADGCDSAVTHLRIRPSGAFARAQCGNTPSCSFAFNVRVQ